ncbi:MAG: polysaccharide biosynthesis C-terminal domain-containing protein [Oscillospiraceae bacterium]|nr:polysaccharide biosynthesis C-terminal domain-containing protein [Oscillospiraceae bacterium]
MGDNRIEDLAPLKKAAVTVTIVSALAVAVLEFPVAAILVRSYRLTPDMQGMVWQYGIGILISMPFGLASTVCVHELMILGKSEILTVFAITEGCVNLVLDLLFVGVFHMGIAGAGYGTAAANMVRCVLSILYLRRKTEIFQYGNAKLRMKDVVRIFRLGSVDASYSAMMALQGILMLKILLAVFGESGGTINAVCRFSLVFASVAIQSIQGSARPLSGIYNGAREVVGLRMLVRRSFLLVLAIVGSITLLVCLFPKTVFFLNGVLEIPAFGLLCLRLFVTHFIFRGFNSIFRLYFAGRGDSRFSSVVTVIGYATLPVFAFLLSHLYAPLFWLAYLAAESLLFLINAAHYAFCVSTDMQSEVPEEAVLYLTVPPEDAIEASQCVRRYAEVHGYPKRLAYRAALCMEEMIHYAVSANGGRDVRNQLMIKFFPDSCIFTIMDDGRCIMLDEDEETKELITNYSMIRKTASSVRYQYILNLNYTVFCFA